MSIENNGGNSCSLCDKHYKRKYITKCPLKTMKVFKIHTAFVMNIIKKIYHKMSIENNEGNSYIYVNMITFLIKDILIIPMFNNVQIDRMI